MDHATYAIRGNHDHGVAQGIPVTGESGFRYLTQATRARRCGMPSGPTRRALPPQAAGDPAIHAGRQTVPAGPCHAARSAGRIPAQGPELWAKRLQNVDADIVCVGHTHMQFNLQVDGIRGPQPGERRAPARRRPARGLRHHRRPQDRVEASRRIPIEETIARIEAMPWPQRAKEMTAYVLRLGRLPLEPAVEGAETAILEDEPDLDLS